MKQIEYREASKEDIDGIIKLNSNLFKEDGGTRDKYINVSWPQQEGRAHFSKFYTKKTHVIFVAEEKGNVIAYIAGYTKRAESLRPVETSEIESMYVLDKYRSKGVGSKLVETFISWSKEKGVKLVSVTAYSKNLKALDFYQKHQFKSHNTTLETEI